MSTIVNGSPDLKDKSNPFNTTPTAGDKARTGAKLEAEAAGQKAEELKNKAGAAGHGAVDMMTGAAQHATQTAQQLAEKSGRGINKLPDQSRKAGNFLTDNWLTNRTVGIDRTAGTQRDRSQEWWNFRTPLIGAAIGFAGFAIGTISDYRRSIPFTNIPTSRAFFVAGAFFAAGVALRFVVRMLPASVSGAKTVPLAAQEPPTFPGVSEAVNPNMSEPSLPRV